MRNWQSWQRRKRIEAPRPRSYAAWNPPAVMRRMVKEAQNDHRAGRRFKPGTGLRTGHADRRFLFSGRGAHRSMAPALGGRSCVAGGDAGFERQAVRRGGRAVCRGDAARSVLCLPGIAADGRDRTGAGRSQPGRRGAAGAAHFISPAERRLSARRDRLGSAAGGGRAACRRCAAAGPAGRQRPQAVLRDAGGDAGGSVAVGARTPRPEAAAAGGGSVCLRDRAGRHLRGRGARRDLQPQSAGGGHSRRLRVPVAARRAGAARVPAAAPEWRGRLHRAGRAGDDAGARRQTVPPRARHLPAHRSRGRRAGRQRRGCAAPPDLPQRRGADGAPPRDSRRRERSLRHTLFQQPQEVRAAPDRHLSRPAHRPRQVGLPIELDPRHGSLLRHQPVPRRIIGDDRWARQPAGAHGHHQEGAGLHRTRLRRQARLLRHQRHVHLEQNRRPGDLHAGRHRRGRPQLPQIASLRPGARGGAAVLRRGLSTAPVLDVRRRAAADHQERAVELPRAGHARSRPRGRPDQLHVRRPHVQHGARHAGVPGDQAGPDLPVGRGVVRVRALQRRSTGAAPR